MLVLVGLVAAPLGVFLVAGGGAGSDEIPIVRETMGSQIGSNACSQNGTVVSCRVVWGAVCRYRVLTGAAATHAYNEGNGIPRGTYIAVVGRCRLDGRRDGGTVGYLTSAASELLACVHQDRVADRSRVAWAQQFQRTREDHRFGVTDQTGGELV